MSLPSRKRGLKFIYIVSGLNTSSRFPRGSVDWNNMKIRLSLIIAVASLAEAWIEINYICCCDWDTFVASLAEAWIEIGTHTTRRYRSATSLPSRKRGLKSTFPQNKRPWPIGHFPCGSVDWNFSHLFFVFFLLFPHESIDWNSKKEMV